MFLPDLLRSVFRRSPPDQGILNLIDHITMDVPAEIRDRAFFPREDHRLFEIRNLAFGFRIDP